MASLRVHVLQHAESTPPGSVLDWLKAKGHAATVVRLFNGDSLPSVEETDWLILLGGGMNVDQTQEFPFLLEEKKLIQAALEKKITCLGLCLGGQLLAQSLGATVKLHAEWEVGWLNARVAPHGFPVAPRHVRSSGWRDSSGDEPNQRNPGLRFWRRYRGIAIPSRGDRRVGQVENNRRPSLTRRRARSNQRTNARGFDFSDATSQVVL